MRDGGRGKVTKRGGVEEGVGGRIVVEGGGVDWRVDGDGGADVGLGEDGGEGLRNTHEEGNEGLKNTHDEPW